MQALAEHAPRGVFAASAIEAGAKVSSRADSHAFTAPTFSLPAVKEISRMSNNRQRKLESRPTQTPPLNRRKAAFTFFARRRYNDDDAHRRNSPLCSTGMAADNHGQTSLRVDTDRGVFYLLQAN